MSDAVIDLVKERRKKAKAEAILSCRFLYSGRNKPMTESLMCFGWECPEAWNEILSDLSYKLEELNIRYYPKFRVRIEASQVKEKFGTLRFYYNCLIDPPKAVQCWSEWLDALARRLDCGSGFEYKYVEISPRHKKHCVKEITKEAYGKAENEKYKCGNVDYQVEGKRYFEIAHYDMFAINTLAPTKKKLRHAVMTLVKKLSAKLDFRGRWPVSTEQRVVSKAMRMDADRLINEAEDETEHACGICGKKIGGRENPVCETVGWVSFLCEKCAASRSGNYLMNGKTYNGGKEVVHGKAVEDAPKIPDPSAGPAV